MANEMSKKYSAPVLPVDCKNMTMDDINSILETVLYQFPIIQINIHTPKWIETLASNHWLKEKSYIHNKGICKKHFRLYKYKRCPFRFCTK